MKDMTKGAARVKRRTAQDLDEPPEQQPDDALDFLYAALGKGARVQLLTIPEDGGPPKGEMFTLGDDDDRIAAWIERAHRRRLNCYFSTARLKGDMTKKATKADIDGARLAFTDIDPPDHIFPQNDGNPGYVVWREATINGLLKMKPTPLVIDSGGGVWPFWPLKEGEAFEDVELLNRHLEHAFMEKPDGTGNIDRIARLAGTVNWPNEKKRDKGRVPRTGEFVGPCDDDLDNLKACTVAEIAAGLGVDLTAELNGTIQNQTTQVGKRKKGREPAKLDGSEWDGEIGELITNPKRHGLGKLPERLREWIFEGAEPGADRSKLVYAVACDLLRREIEPETVAAVLLSDALPISAHALDQQNPERAVRRVVSAAIKRVEEDGVWPDGMVEKPAKSGRWVPTATLGNTVHAIRRLDIDIRYDAFRRKIIIGGHAVDEYAGELQDEALVVLRNLVRDATPGFDPGKEHLHDAALSISQDRRFNPVWDYLDGVVWDGRPRLRKWLRVVFGCERNEYTTQIGELIIRAMVRRAKTPGAKFDIMAIIEGPQGIGKSRAARALCPMDDLFSEASILGKNDDKVIGELLQGVWLAECAELEGMSKRDTGELKAIITRRADRYRAAWGRVVSDRPRTAIFIGTTNESNYLRDDTGNRRFAPFKATRADVDWIKANRDQLFAEAMKLESNGGHLERLDFTGEAEAIHSGEAAARMVEDPLAEQMGEVLGERDGWLMLKDAAQAVGVAAVDLRNAHQTRPFSRALRALGFVQQSRIVAGIKKRIYVRDAQGRLGASGKIPDNARLVA